MVKKLGTLVNKESEIIHSPFNGEKILGREALSTKIKTKDGSWHEVKLHSYSPFGIEFVNDNIDLKQGQSIDIRIKLAGDETEFSGLVVTSIHEDNGLRLAGVRTFVKDKLDQNEYSGSDRRSHRRWNCSEDFLPTGTAPNPVRYNDYILFRVEDISKGGLKIITSMRNKFVGIGQRLECTLSLPYVGTVRVDVKVKHVNTTFYRGKEFMVMGLEFINIDPFLLRNLGEYLLNFSKDVTAKSLNAEGFGIKNISKWLDFSYVKTKEEYKEVLKLRLKAYQIVGKVDENKNSEYMSDEYDSNANIVVAKHNGKIVGSMRINFYNSTNQKTQIEKYVNYSKNFPPKNELAEISRLCTDPEFKGTDILYEMQAYKVLAAIRNNKKYLLGVAEGSLVDYYEKSGWERTNITYEQKFFSDHRPREILFLDINKILSGKGIRLRNWVKLYHHLSSHLIKHQIVNPSLLDLLRINSYRVIGKIFYAQGK